MRYLNKVIFKKMIMCTLISIKNTNNLLKIKILENYFLKDMINCLEFLVFDKLKAKMIKKTKKTQEIKYKKVFVF
jgi:hypothetical protein